MTTRIHIRRSVFETNSSSSHSLTVRERDLADMPLSEATLREGVLRVSPDDYGWEWKRYYLAENKLSYLLTYIVGGDLDQSFWGAEEFTQQLCERYPQIAEICQLIERHTGCRVEISGGEGSIDHESSHLGGEALENTQTLSNFLFSPYSYVETGNDNDSSPSSISTDMGDSEPYHQPRQAPKAKSASKRPTF